MVTFDRDDEAYVSWLAVHPHGFVINAHRKPQPDYLIPHRATCVFISRTAEPPVRWTTSDYIKVCAETDAELAEWCRSEGGGNLQPCGKCHPI